MDHINPFPSVRRFMLSLSMVVAAGLGLGASDASAAGFAVCDHDVGFCSYDPNNCTNCCVQYNCGSGGCAGSGDRCVRCEAC